MSDVPGSQLDFAAYAAARFGGQATLVAVQTRRIEKGYASPGIFQHDVEVRLGSRRADCSFVQKLCGEAEVRTMQALERLGGEYCIPQLVDIGRAASQGPAWFLMPLYADPELRLGDPFPAEAARTLAKVHATFERAPVDWLAPIAGEDVETLFQRAVSAIEAQARERSSQYKAAATALEAACRRSVLQRLADSLPRTLTHGDVHPGNIMSSEAGRPVLIDWGNARFAPVGLDLANMLPIGSDAWNVYGKAYREAGGRLDEAMLRENHCWARAVTALQYLPWALENASNGLRLVDQVVDSEKQLRSPL